MADEEDYGYGVVGDVVKQTSSSGKYLRLDKDVPVQVRIASKPRYAIRHWAEGIRKYVAHEEPDCQWCGKSAKEPLRKDAQWYWIVIDRADEQVKIMQATNTVARRLQEISQIKNKKTGTVSWGNPTTFDVSILKYEKANGFTDYKVEPLVDSRGPLTPEEVKAVQDSGYDLDQEVHGAKESQHLGNYGGENPLETAMEQADAELASDIDIDQVSQAIDDEEMPF